MLNTSRVYDQQGSVLRIRNMLNEKANCAVHSMDNRLATKNNIYKDKKPRKANCLS